MADIQDSNEQKILTSDFETSSKSVPGVTSTTPVGASLLTINSPRRASGLDTSPRLGPRRLENLTEEREDGNSEKDSANKLSAKPEIGKSLNRKWSGLGQQFQGASIWNDPNRRPSTDLSRGIAFSDIGTVPRSIGFSAAHSEDSKQPIKHANLEDLDSEYLTSINDDLTTDEYEQIIMEKLRQARSNSMLNLGSVGTASPRRGSTQAEGNSLWRGLNSRLLTEAHRRSLSTASTGPPPGFSTPRTHLNVLDNNSNQRRFSLAPAQTPSTTPHNLRYMAMSRTPSMTGSASDFENLSASRRNSLAGPAPAPHTASSSAAYRHLSDALDHLKLDEFRRAQYGGLATDDTDECLNTKESSDLIADVGKGIPLSAIPTSIPLYVVEFKAGRSDLFYAADAMTAMVKKNDLVIVEADRGKDLGKVTNDNITPIQVKQLQQQQAEYLPDLNRVNKELHPKRICRLAQPGEVAMLAKKSQDELKALQICQAKVRQKELPMEVIDAEFQWDRCKLTFYFIADHRIDFRDLVRELFKLYKARIWMCAVNLEASIGTVPGVSKASTSPASSPIKPS